MTQEHDRHRSFEDDGHAIGGNSNDLESLPDLTCMSDDELLRYAIERRAWWLLIKR